MPRYPNRESLECPHCHCRHSFVRHTEITESRWRGKVKNFIRRTRVCRHCNIPFTTVELHEDEDRKGYPEPELPPPVPEQEPLPENPPENPYV